MKAFVLLSASALGGLCLGLTFESGRRTGVRPVLGVEAEALPSKQLGEQSREATVPVVLPGQAEAESFASLPFERQSEVLRRWVSKRSALRSSSDELTILRAVQTLFSYEQAAALLESFASAPAGKGDSLEFVRVALKERLAALDPKVALEQGRQRGDPQLRSAAVVALMQKNAAEGLRAVAQLSEKERERIWDLAGAFTKPGGTIQELTALLKEMPQLGTVTEFSLGMEGSLAFLAARIMAADPARGLGELRRIEAELLAAKGQGNTGASEQQQPPLHLILGMMMELRSLSPEAARTVFDALSEGEKSNFVVSMEAAARLKETGTDAAIRFAETQTNENFLKEAARGVWQALAQEDRASALQWIESLPEGPFREGVFSSVMREALMRSRTSRNAQDAFQAGAELLSKKTQLDYYSYLVSKNPLTPSEVIAGLPISEADKQELQRRAAPVRPQ